MADRKFRTDSFGHPLANWDDHDDCRTCMHNKDIFCARGTLCEVCAEWSEEKWRKWDSAIISASLKKAKRASIAQHRAAQLAGTVLSKGLAPATPATQMEAAPGPKPRAVPIPAAQHPPVSAPASVTVRICTGNAVPDTPPPATGTGRH